MAPEVPKGKTATFLYVVRCKRGHEWFTYSDSESSHWGPAQCRECEDAQVSAKVYKKLTAHEVAGLKRFHVVMKARLTPTSPMDDTTEEDVDAQEMRETLRNWEFLVGDVIVQRFPRALVIGKPVLKP